MLMELQENYDFSHGVGPSRVDFWSWITQLFSLVIIAVTIVPYTVLSWMRQPTLSYLRQPDEEYTADMKNNDKLLKYRKVVLMLVLLLKCGLAFSVVLFTSSCIRLLAAKSPLHCFPTILGYLMDDAQMGFYEVCNYDKMFLFRTS